MKQKITLPPTQDPAIVAMAEELGALEQEFAPLAHKVARIDQLRKLLRTRFADENACDAFTITGEHFVLTLGPRGNQTGINVEELAKALGIRKFAKLATVTLKSLQEHVAADVIAAHTWTVPTGSRTISITEKGAQAK